MHVRCTWAGDHLVATTPKRLVALDAPYLVLVHSGAARREFDDAVEELQQAIAQRHAAV